MKIILSLFLALAAMQNHASGQQVAITGFTLISLEEAESDAAYRGEPDLRSTWEGTLLDQMLRAKGLKRPVQPQPPFAKLDALCR